MRALVLISVLIVILPLSGRAQLYFPNQQYYKTEIDRYFVEHDSLKTFANSHLSLGPILDKKTNRDSIYYKDSKHYYWITQKIFKENFLIFKGRDFWCSVDPIMDFEAGRDISSDSTHLFYWNTRGLRVQGRFLEKVAFSTSIYENQAVVPKYLSDYADAHGEFRIVPQGYVQDNAVIPGYARTKPFKTNGYDFAFAEGNVSIVPTDWINFQFGNGNHRIGNGYRSLLLSDFSANYPFAKIETTLLKGRLQYNAIYAIHQNLYRMPFYESVEATFERKIGTYHYLDFAITKNIQIGLFEGAHWKRSDSTGTHNPNWLFTNPLPFVNGIIQSKDTLGYNHIFGLNYTFTFLKNRLYGQLVLDNGTIGGIQVGLNSYGQFVKGLDLQLEFNSVSNFTYIANEKRYNYSNYNMPLAHPLSSGFNEGIVRISYEKRGFFASNKTVYYNQKYAQLQSDGTDILNDELFDNPSIDQQRNVLINTVEVGYRFNKNYNFQAVIGWMFREEYLSNSIHNTNYIYAGLRTSLRNKTLDF